MAPKKTVPSPSAVYTPTTPVDPDHEARLKAEARAYALSGATSGSKRKSPPTSSHATRHGHATAGGQDKNKPTTLSIHRPEKQQKPNSRSSAGSLGASTGSAGLGSVIDPTNDDYERFVKSLGLDESFFASIDNDDEDFHLSDIDDDDEEDEDDDEMNLQTGLNSDAPPNEPQHKRVDSTPPLSSPLTSSPMTLPDFESGMYQDLEEELGSLLEEDMEAAVQSLMTSKKPTTPAPATPSAKASTSTAKKKTPKDGDADATKNESPATPLRETARQGTRTQVSYQQSQQLRRLLTRHYQLLVQQSILAVRAAHMQKTHKDKSDFLSGETADDLAEILDGAVGMLQDLDQNRKDAIRNSIQLSGTMPGASTNKVLSGRRSLLSRFAESSNTQDEQSKGRRLTRSAFSKTLEQQGVGGAKRTAFDIPGLMKLKETFLTIDKSVEGVKGSYNILDVPTHAEACRTVLRQAMAHVDETHITGVRDLSENFCDAKEIFGEDFIAPCSDEQRLFLRRNRNLFSSGEDNLVLRGVNLYGEKQWILIADRYLPDRSVNIISQRYSKLCVMLYRANGISIDAKGNLDPPPKLESVDDIDEARVKELNLGAVDPPAILNVHRWSLEEDLSLLKAVPIMGHMWAELGARLIPHRDRGHLRKRYQVLDRRVKAAVARISKGDSAGLKVPRQQSAPRKTTTPAVSTRPPLAKPGTKGSIARVLSKKTPARKSGTKAAPMTIENAAATLTFLQPRTSADEPTAQAPVKPPAPAATRSARKNAKVIPAAGAAKQNQRKPAVPKRPPPKLPFSKSSTPSKAGVDSHLNTDLTSRTAFEKLVDGTSEEWSQMSRMKKMMENDDESQAADAIVSHLARSPGRSGLPRLPQMPLDTNSMSGLSILQSDLPRPIRKNSDLSRSHTTSGSSFMARVLEGTSKGSATEETAPDKSTAKAAKKMESPRKRPALKSSANPLSLAPPSTPKRTNFFSTSGTPIGLSPGFRPSPGLMRNGGSITLTPNVHYSPAPSTVMRLMSEQSGDDIRFCDFQISEESQKEIEAVPREPQHDPTPPPLTPSKNSLMFDDLEAISALNSLSNSPFRQRNGQEDKEATIGGGLFATVMGGRKDKDPRTRLQF